MKFMALLIEKTFYFLIDSYLIDSAFAAVKRDAEFNSRYTEGIQKGDLFHEHWYITG